MYFVHFPIFYLSLFLLLVILMSGITGVDIRKVIKTASVGLFAILLVPFIDWIINQGFLITYPLRWQTYVTNFLNPMVSLSDMGISPGQRIVVFSIAVLTGVYGRIKTGNMLKGFVLFLASLLAIIFFGCLTTILAGNRPEHVFVAGSILYTDTQKFAAIYALLFSALSFLFLYVVSRRNLETIIRTVRLERLIFYGAMAIFGFILSMHQLGMRFDGHEFSYLALAMMFMSLCFGFWSMQVVNDFYDVDIDRVVSKRNPLLRGVGRDYYKIFGFTLLFMALSYAFILNFTALLILSSYLLLGIIYSMPPVRLKRIPLISTFVIALAVTLSIAFGFSVYYGNRAVNAIPGRLLAPTLFAITLGFIAKDINDVPGDRKHGVITLPVLLYDRGTLIGRLPVAIIISCSFLVYIPFIPQIVLGALVGAAGTLLYTLLLRNPGEWFYFLMLYVFGGYMLYTLLSLPPL